MDHHHASPAPKLVFIVPYRDRVPHKTFFTHYTESVTMRDYVRDRDYAIYFAHQRDARPFNRGAMKNIGFLAIKYRYPAEYKDITFVFNDIDTVPYDKDVLHYDTPCGTIKHFYGFTYALGGIFSVKGSDFERIGGFPNFWAWGCEDNCIYNRAISAGLTVDRSTFFTIGDQRILHLYDGATRNICRTEALSAQRRTTLESLSTIRNLEFEFNGENGEFIDVLRFDTMVDPGTITLETQNILTTPNIDLTPAIKQLELEQRRVKMQSAQSFMQMPQFSTVTQLLPQQPEQTAHSILRRPFMMPGYTKQKRH
jgi:hypothetical protein